ncbi:molybdate ABC transporter substrate-binding protein [Ramlibacter albus]|uniref:Substrate-binding domain-containing protein n=1 Tax=Ramlibacter albus TaxID=2079448 RepID=A0A923M3I1_9BURK|nr:substrate-binding domain-containing protein [Ramlibacter albus]MBC5763260.1 substrate-binding domain-containing protein [Ramlibacter albus]
MSEPVRIISGGAAQGLVRALQLPVEGHFGAVGAMKDKLLGGEPCDILILTEALIRELEAAGHVRAGSARAIGKVETGVALKERAATRSIASGVELKQLLESASEIYFPDPAKATAGIHFMKVLTALGLAETHASRFRTFPNGATAMGELAKSGAADAVGCTQVTEILITPGVQLIGLLPAPYSLATTYTAAVPTKATQPDKARELIERMCAAETASARKLAGFA